MRTTKNTDNKEVTQTDTSNRDKKKKKKQADEYEENKQTHTRSSSVISYALNTCKTETRQFHISSQFPRGALKLKVAGRLCFRG